MVFFLAQKVQNLFNAWIVLQKICVILVLILCLVFLLWIEMLILPVFFLAPDRAINMLNIYCRVFAYLLGYTVTIGNKKVFAIYNRNGKKVNSFKDLWYPTSSYVIICNHISAMDTVIVRLFGVSALGIDVKYVTKRSIMWIPILGLGMYMCRFLFVRRDKKKDSKSIKAWVAAMNGREKDAFILYPEGTRFTQKKHERSILFCRQKNLPVLKNLLYPRLAGFSTCINALNRKKFLRIADLTIIYTENEQRSIPPNFWRLLLLPVPGTFHILCGSDSTDNIDNPEEYLVNAFRKKDEKISEFISSPPSQAGIPAHSS